MKRGEVYLWSRYTDGTETRVKLLERIIQFDDYEVHCDSIRLEDVYSRWRMDKKLRTEIFTRSRRHPFPITHEYCDFEPIEQESIDYYHLTLPMKICRFNDISWGDELFNDTERIQEYLSQSPNREQVERVLQCKEMYLAGCNKNWRTQKPVLISPNNGIHFTVDELMYKANEIQTAIKSNKNFKTDGIGIYRSGMVKGLPSYYIWGYYDLANFLKDCEEEGIDISNA